MAKYPLVFKSFVGGKATDLKLGIKNSFANSQSMDFRKNPSQLSVLPQPTKEDAGVVTDLVQNEVMVKSGLIYATGSSGQFYKRTTAGVWSSEAKLSTGTYGISYRQDADAIYITSPKTVSLYNQVSSNPTIYPDNYDKSYSTLNNSATVGFNVAAFQEGSANQTAIVGAAGIIEDQAHRRYFQSDIEPLTRISLFLTNFAAPTITVTVHDGNDNVVATSQITVNGSVQSAGWYDFDITPQTRIYIAPNARTYHIHVTATTTCRVSSTATDDLSTCDLKVWADRLIDTTNGMHPMARFLQYECIGNGNYLSAWEPISDVPTNAEWQRHRLVFPQEYEVCGLAVQNEFLVIAAEKNTTTAGNTQQEGILFFWDGTSTTYNYDVRIPEGSPYAIHEYKNVIYYYAGGAWYAITGPASQPIKLRTMPGTDTEYSGAAAPITVYPYAATVRRGIHMLGWPSATTNTSINYGVYSYGAIDKNFPDSFGYSYVISTSSKNYSGSNNLQIGMVKSFGDTMHISWRDTLNGGYGVDVVNNASAPATTAYWESLIFDNGVTTKDKSALYMRMTLATFPSDATVTLKYSIDRGAWITSTVKTSVDTNVLEFDINDRFHEIQVGFDLTCGTTTPVITSVVFVYDDLSEEKRF